MAAIIRIKRSTGTSAPSTLKTGELAYSQGTGTFGNGGDRLYFGKGDDGSGNATSVVVIGGEYFSSLFTTSVDVGVLEAEKVVTVDVNKKVDEWNVDNIKIDGNTISSTNSNGNVVLETNGTGIIDVNANVDVTGSITHTGDTIQTGTNTVTGQLNVDNIRVDGNTISSTDTNGNVVIDPNGTGVIDASTSKITNVVDPTANQDAATKKYVDDQFAGDAVVFTIAGDVGVADNIQGQETVTFEGDSDILTTITDNTVTFTHRTSDVTPGTYGSQTEIPVFTVNGNGHLDSAGTVPLATILNTNADTGTGDVALLDSSFSFSGGTNIHTVASNNNIIIHLDSDVQDLSGLNVNGEVDIVGDLDVDNININGNSITSTDANGNINLTPQGTGEVVASSLTVSDLTNNRLVVVGPSGALEDDANLTWDGTTLTVTGDMTYSGTQTITGQLNVDNIRIDGNTISSQDGSNVMYIDPAPVDSDGGDLIIRGNLIVQGVQTVVNSTVVSLNDIALVLADSAADAAAADGAGIIIGGDQFTGTKPQIIYDAATNRWDPNIAIDLPDSIGGASLYFGGTQVAEAIEDHLATNVFLGHDSSGQDITYNDANGTITFSNQYATLTNVGTASFGGWADSEGAGRRQFSLSAKGDVTIAEIDGGTY